MKRPLTGSQTLTHGYHRIYLGINSNCCSTSPALLLHLSNPHSPPPPPPPPQPPWTSSQPKFRSHSLSPSSFSPTHSPLHPSPVTLFPTVTYSSEAAQHSHPPPLECAICMEEFKEGDIGPVLPNCDHFFHLHCIDEWVQSNKTCPLCRKVVNAPPGITSRHGNTEASAREEHRSENSSNVNLPPPIWCPRNTWPVMQLGGVIIEIPQQHHGRS